MENILTSYGGKKTMIRRYVYGNVIENRSRIDQTGTGKRRTALFYRG